MKLTPLYPCLVGEQIKQFTAYMNQVEKNVGRVYSTAKTVEQTGPVVETVPYERQKEAMAFLNTQLFTTPEWLFDPEVKAKTDVDFVNVLRVPSL